MPTYDYECKKCAHVFEAFQRMTDSPLQECPKCKGPVERRIGTGAGIIFKGKGFYQTDYKNSNCSGGSSDKKNTACEKAGTCPCAKK